MKPKMFLKLGRVAAFAAVLVLGASRAYPAADAGSGPHVVLIIRHAEKPDDSDGKKDPNLSPKGYRRAAALATVIPEDFPKPAFLFATKETKKSDRPVETITPLAAALHEPIDSDFKDDDVDPLAHELLTDAKYDHAVVLIAWHHEKIPDLAKALGVKNAPDHWDSTVFDRVWKITYKDGVATFENLPEKALPGDSQN